MKSHRCNRVKMHLLVVIVLILAKDSFGQQQQQRCEGNKIKLRPLMMRGYEAYPGQFPWHVAIFREDQYICGGSFISENHVLTAAHCVPVGLERRARPRGLKVVAGLHNAKVFGKNSKQYSVYEIHTVPTEEPWIGLKNDIALLEFGRSQPICLNSEQESDQEVGMVPGWGKTESQEISQILKTASMPIIDGMACLASNREAFERKLDAGMICAGHQNGTSACNGDSGGGLVVKRCTVGQCYWFLVGVVSFSADDGKGSCRSDGYGVFVKVRTYLAWISQITGMELADNSAHNSFALQQDESTRSRWPWHGTMYRVGLYFSIENINAMEAFGVTILTNELVLTTAECAMSYRANPAAHRVRFGHPPVLFADRFTQTFAIEKAFTSEPRSNDIQNLAIFKLRGRIEFTKYVQPVRGPQ